MPECSVCGNDYHDAFVVTKADGQQQTFDSIECAAHAVAPRCGHCGCMILGHGVQVRGTAYCCSHCARTDAGADLTDAQ